MKTRFSTFDLVCSLTELQRLIGMRVGQVYDIDNKTYLIKLQRTEEKSVLLLESGNRIHTTGFEWPKNIAPSGFSMKMRKHLRNKRLESLRQLGMDRIVDLQFGTGEAAYHVILELYDRGNIVLTDCTYTILNILRPHTEGDKIRFAVREKYPLDRAHPREGPPSEEKLRSIFEGAKVGDTLKKILTPHLEYGPAVIEHVLLKAGFAANCKLGKGFSIDEDTTKLSSALQEAEQLIDIAMKTPSKGFIIQKKEKRPLAEGGEEDFFTNQEFHPIIFQQHSQQPFKEFQTFDVAVDEFFSTLESQKIDLKALQQEKEAMKKLENVRKDHHQRLEALTRTQEEDKKRAELITRNQALVDAAILAVRTALANQVSWPDIQNIVKEAQARGDPIASCIKNLKLEVNHISLLLSDPYAGDTSSDEDSFDTLKPMMIDVDLDLTAFSNARKYYDQKRNAAKKQQKTLESQGKALKSAEKKTKQALKEVKTITSINKARKVYWFEKFHWFISSENYLVIGGRDPQQNELIVKRYMRPGDVYVHADIQGASSIVIKNPSGQPVPPKTLNEAGVMAMSYSVAWDAKVVTSAWWVQSDQVSKTAPTGEYLTTGAFMIRGKKNYLLPAHLIMGFSFLFRLEESSVERHKDERRVRGADEDDVSSIAATTEEMSLESEQDQEIELMGSDEEIEGDNAAGVESEKLEHGDKQDDKDSEHGDDRNKDSDDGDGEEGDEEADEGENSSDSDEEKSSEEKDTQSENKVEFPDIEIKIEHKKDNLITMHAPTAPTIGTHLDSSNENQVVFLGDDKPVVLKSNTGRQRKPSENKGRSNSVKFEEKEDKAQGKQQQQQQQQQMKRGQKAKLKKIKEKYKYQDEEERKLRMEILQSAGSAKDSKKAKKGKEQGGKLSKKLEKKPPPRPKILAPRPTGEDSDGGEAAEEVTVAADVDMLDSLTGIPLLEDELLFAVPVIAPYSTLHNYKYKVKLTPGTGKRGKAAKTALNMFLKDRSATQREKDLIRSVKDEDLARNIPGKVKVSAPQLQKLRK
ncbi:ribosome quality control complex subunit NEMF homolog [Anabrus simplex]|uniref:ribosome quality control complex subunit NEMF homolog n=1 Tax=Anabrus simplex TaxID=316456 RepID=UPI0035A2A9A9